MTSPSVSYIAMGVKGGLRDLIGPLRGGLGVAPLEKKIPRETCHIFTSFFRVTLIFCVHCWAFFWHMVFFDGFLFLVKELGLLTYPDHWVRFLDVIGSYMYFNIPIHPG
jgi:hypothetical protein